MSKHEKSDLKTNLDKLNLKMIVAFDNNKAIGLDNNLLWHLPEDLKLFKKLTSGNYVLMGRKTFESIFAILGKPLPDRTSLILTRNNSLMDNIGNKSDDCVILNSIDDFLKFHESFILGENLDKDVFCIGGANIYAQLLPYTKTLYVTEVDTEIKSADAYFPDIDLDGSDWFLEHEQVYSKDEKHAFDFAFKQYTRIMMPK